MTPRLALLGCGWVADMHARAAAECGHAVVAVANHRLESAERFASEHGIEQVTTDWSALVAADDVDVVIVCTPNALHAEQSMAALAAGKHVLCEKPMATTTADGEAMLAAAAQHDRLLLVLHPWRHHPAVIAVRDAVAAATSAASYARTATASTPTGARAAGSPIRRWPAVARSSTWASTRSTPRASCSAIRKRGAWPRRSRRPTAATRSTTTVWC